MNEEQTVAPSRSCVNCPSFLSAEKVLEVYKNDAGPMCGRFGHLLGTKSSSAGQVNALGIEYAKTCDKFGEVAPFKPIIIPRAQVAQPNAALMTEAIQHAQSDGYIPPSSCRECVFMVPDRVVEEEIGWRLPMCSVQGRVIFTRNRREEARTCGYGCNSWTADTVQASKSASWQVGNPDFDGLNTNALLDHYRKVLIDQDFDDDPTGGFDPQTYATEKPVSPEESQAGIRAWFKAGRDRAGEPVFLPTFAASFIPEDQQDLVPRFGDPTHPESYIDHMGLVEKLAIEWMGLDSNPVLHGHAGCGKTEVARYIATKMGLPFIRINFDATTMPDDIVGSWVFMDGETIFAPGRLTTWWQRPCVLLFDEYKLAPDEIQGMLRPVLDGDQKLPLEKMRSKVRRPDGTLEIVTPPPAARHPFCFPVFAANPEWSPLYVGVNPDDPAGISRKSHIWVDFPPAEIERRIILNSCKRDGYRPKTELVDLVMRIAGDIRENVQSGALPVAWGMRESIGVLRRTKYYSLFESYRRTALDAYDPKMADAVFDIIKRYASDKD